jgi:hypothetical protein
MALVLLARQEVQQFIDVDIQAVTQRNKVGKPHLALLRPVEDGVGDGGGLRNKRQLAAIIGTGEKLALRPCQGASRPRLFGPSRRIW